MVDKNTGKALRYVDPKTGKITDGEYKVADDLTEMVKIEQNAEAFKYAGAGVSGLGESKRFYS